MTESLSITLACDFLQCSSGELRITGAVRAGCDAAAFPDVDAFLKQADILDDCCVVADIRMPGTSSLDLPKLLNERGFKAPVIFVTAYDDDQSRTEAKRAGAAADIRKPVDDHALLEAIRWALDEANQSTQSDSSTTRK